MSSEFIPLPRNMEFDIINTSYIGNKASQFPIHNVPFFSELNIYQDNFPLNFVYLLYPNTKYTENP